MPGHLRLCPPRSGLPAGRRPLVLWRGRPWRILTALLACLAFDAAPGGAQSGTIRYVYDALDRLVAVVDQHGNTATYRYDAVGNLLAIERFDAGETREPVRITLVSPGSGREGTTVQIFGAGFGPTPADNTVTFNGAAAPVTVAAFTRLIVTVPAGASTGAILVTSPLGAAVSPAAFRVPGIVTIVPAGAVVTTNATRQFTATESANAGVRFRWSVNGTVGGDGTVGTVSSTGLYTAPAGVPAPSVVTLAAVDPDEPTSFTTVPILIVAPSSELLAFSTDLSVRVASAPVPALAAAALSLRVSSEPSPALAASPAVSLQVKPLALPGLVAGAPLSVRVSSGPPPVFAVSGAVSVGVEPVVTAVSPAVAARGSKLRITVTGAGLASATGVRFLRDNAEDAAIEVITISVDPAGRQLTADISIAAQALGGARVVQVTTPGASSTVAGASSLFTVE